MQDSRSIGHSCPALDSLGPEVLPVHLPTTLPCSQGFPTYSHYACAFPFIFKHLKHHCQLMEMNQTLSMRDIGWECSGGRLLITQEECPAVSCPGKWAPPNHPSWPTAQSPELSMMHALSLALRSSKMKFSVRVIWRVLIAALVIIKIYLVDMASSVNKSCGDKEREEELARLY